MFIVQNSTSTGTGHLHSVYPNMDRKFSYKALAERVGVNPRTVKRWVAEKLLSAPEIIRLPHTEIEIALFPATAIDEAERARDRKRR